MRVKVGFSFLAFNALLFMLRDPALISGFYGACAVHEAGHLAALRLTGGHVRAVELSCFGVRITADPPPGRPREAAVLLCGPAADLLLWGALELTGHPGYTSELSLWEGLVNLLPLGFLDGGALLGLYLSGWSRFTAGLLLTAAVVGILALRT